MSDPPTEDGVTLSDKLKRALRALRPRAPRRRRRRGLPAGIAGAAAVKPEAPPNSVDTQDRSNPRRRFL